MEHTEPSIPKTVTRNRWNVATVTSSDRPGEHRLEVFTTYAGEFVYPRDHGRVFRSHAGAKAYALARGYTQVYIPRELRG